MIRVSFFYRNDTRVVSAPVFAVDAHYFGLVAILQLQIKKRETGFYVGWRLWSGSA